MVSPEQAAWEEHFCLPFYRNGWKDINTAYLESHRLYADCCPAGAQEELWGVFATSCGTDWAGMNFAFLTEPVRAVKRFHPRLDLIESFYRRRHLPWILVVPDTWVAPDQRDALHRYLQAEGCTLAMDAYAIEADSLIPLPATDFEIRRVGDLAGWQALGAINAGAWNVALETISPLFESSRFQKCARGFLGFEEGVPVAAMAEFQADRYSYVSWGATLPSHRKRGYGERMIRHAASLCEAGRPVLGISGPEGLSAWLRSGFRRGERFRLYSGPTI